MKYSYKTLLSTIALGSAMIFAQAPAQPVAPAAQPAPEAQAPAPAAPATPAESAAAPAPAATPAPAAADSTVKEQPAPTETATAPAVNDSTAQAAAAKPDSLASAPVAAADSAQQAPDSTVAAVSAADSATSGFVADTTTPPPSLLEGTEIAGDIHGFLKLDQSPYIATDLLIVPPNTSLVIAPGVVIYFKPGTGIQVNKGQLVIAGTKISPVTLRSAYDRPKAGDWLGVTITGDERAEIRNVQVSDAAVGIAVENGSMDLKDAKIENTSVRGVYLRNASASISDCEFTNNQVALQVSNYAKADIDRGSFEKNNVAIMNSELAEAHVSSAKIEDNEVGILNMGNSLITLNNTEITKNKQGVSSAEVLAPEIIERVKENTLDLDNQASAVAATLPPAPEIPGIEQRPVRASDKIGDIVAERLDAEVKVDSTQSRWSVIGNVMYGSAYHYVKTRKNDTSKEIILGTDSIAPGDHYKNNFQVPGLAARASAYLIMQSVEGQTLEFNADLTMDSWNKFSPNPISLSYTDEFNKATLGDFQLAGGETYMAGIPVFGIDYTLSLLKNNADQPLFQMNGFFGEAQRSLVEGARHPYLYNDYIDDGELQAQRLAYGGYLKWAPVRRFDAKFGVIYADDEIHDPLLRDGASTKWSTSDPMQESFTLFADGNWLFFPGDIELNGQIAVGRADTTDVVRQRAINKVFSDAGISTSAYTLLRQLMQNQSRINTLSEAELLSIFGDNTTLRKTAMQDSLRVLISKAKLAQKEEEEERDDDRVLGLNWGSQNFAIGASLNWNIYKTSINGHIKYVGEDFYSAGSPNQLSDTREFGGRIEQDILGFWDLGFSYQINVENAAKGDKTNIFGLGEGTEWGLFPDEDDAWFDEHERDNDRTKYIQNIGLDNTFKLNKNVDLSVGYNFEYKTQYRPFQLHYNYTLEDGIYRDGWFDARKGRDSTMIIEGKDTTYVDAERWSEYMALANEPHLASRFQERLFRHTWNLGTTIRAYNSVFKIGGQWTYRTDGSLFHKDSLIEDMDLSNSTYDKLGYFFGGSDYFEQTYPLSVTTTLPILQNRFSLTPRFKSYKRDDMSEFEISIEDEFEMPFKNNFFVLGVNAGFRYMTTEWEEEDESFDETETDVLGTVNLRVNHNKRFYTEWYTGAAFYYRPDNLSNEYKDVYVGVNAHYVF